MNLSTPFSYTRMSCSCFDISIRSAARASVAMLAAPSAMQHSNNIRKTFAIVRSPTMTSSIARAFCTRAKHLCQEHLDFSYRITYGVDVPVREDVLMRNGSRSLHRCAMRVLTKLCLCVMLLAATALAPSASHADQLTWHVTNMSPYNAEIRFFSRYRAQNRVWPAESDQVWQLYDHDIHTIVLKCITGEQICFGAWLPHTHTRYWGVGHDHDQSCGNCCAICGNGDAEAVLDDEQ